MIKYVVVALMMLPGCGCDADVGAGADVHCVQTRIDANGHKYQYLLPECGGDPDTTVGTPVHQPSGTVADADMSTTPVVDNPVADMAMSTTTTGGDGGTDDCANVVCPQGETCNAGTCIPVTACQPTDPTCIHDGVCLSVEASYMTTICHVPQGNPDDRHELCVGNPSVPTHLANGDYLGDCLQ